MDLDNVRDAEPTVRRSCSHIGPAPRRAGSPQALSLHLSLERGLGLCHWADEMSLSCSVLIWESIAPYWAGPSRFDIRGGVPTPDADPTRAHRPPALPARRIVEPPADPQGKGCHVRGQVQKQQNQGRIADAP